MKIDLEEKRLSKGIEADEWTSVKDIISYKKHLREVASRTMLKDQRMNIRIAKRDLDGLKAKALEEGIPYQTLVSSILHKYVIGKLKEKGLFSFPSG
jgi:predicted DNA binding CopG/RHH family protein